MMRPGHLREATAKAAAKARHTLRTRLSTGEKSCRKRMATLAVVHDAEPAIRRPHDIIAPPGGRTGHRTVRKGPVARAKWLTASVREDAETVIAAAFGQAEARDPEHHRTWVVLIDGATHQRGGYAAALRREVEQRTSDSKDGTIRTKVFGVGADAGRRENREVVSRYLEVAEPISVIGLVMDVLEEKDVIVPRRSRPADGPSSAEPGAAGTPVRGAAVPGRRRAGRRAPC
ncbi:hypothetical protein [Streptomyces sp. NPDC048340]|uniref:hypothetical protein n=1 Tax=Streptomyces sp. NPDC048340 TaxID=3365537 RepID=UPI00371EDCF2